MIKLNTPYTIENGDTVTFTEGKKGSITGTYGDGTLTGIVEGNLLKATFHNTKANATGLMEITFNENGFDAKWKSGLEPGLMRGKWEGKLNPENKSQQNTGIEIINLELSEEQKKYLEDGVWWRDFDGDEKEQKLKKSWLLNKTFLLEAVKQSGSIIQFAPESFKNDRAIFLDAVKSDGTALEFASDKFKKDKEVVLAAVSDYGNALEFASDDLKADKEIILVAVKNSERALSYASDNLKKDREVVLEAIKNDVHGTILEYVSDDIKSDKRIILEAVKIAGKSLSYASQSLKNDREVVLEAIKKDKNSIEFASDELNGDPEIVIAALTQDSYALYYVRSEAILKELAESSTIGGHKINFKVRDLVQGVQKLFEKKLFDENGDLKEEFESICNDWFDFNEIIYQNQKMDGDALLSIAQVMQGKYFPNPRDGRDVEEYTRELLVEAIELNDDSLHDIITYGFNVDEYRDFSDLAEKACELLWNRGEKNYASALQVLSNDNGELINGLSNEFALNIASEARELDSGEEEDKENFENFVSEAGLE